mgnify:FL=1
MDEKQVVGIIKDAGNVNLMGKKSIELGLKAGIIEKENIIKIKGVPHAQSTSFR